MDVSAAEGGRRRWRRTIMTRRPPHAARPCNSRASPSGEASHEHSGGVADGGVKRFGGEDPQDRPPPEDLGTMGFG
jgi:hypothetical protein